MGTYFAMENIDNLSSGSLELMLADLELVLADPPEVPFAHRRWDEPASLFAHRRGLKIRSR